MNYYLGIDGGGSDTRAVLADAQGHAVAQARAGSLNYRGMGMETARASLREIMGQIADAVLGDQGAIHAAFIGNAALAGPAPAEELHALCDGILAPEYLAMDSDLFIALEAMNSHPNEPVGSPGAPVSGPCAVAIAGTGSMAAGRAGEGQPILHTGGWGWLLGDEGSGFHIGWEGIRAGLRGLEGSGPATALAEEICGFYGAPPLEPEALLDIFYNPPKEPREIASFARVVLNSDDAVAREIVARCAKSFADTVRALLDRLPENTKLGLWGGMFQHSEAYRAAFCAALGIQADLLPAAPEWGAVQAAMKFGIRNSEFGMGGCA